MNRLLDNTKRSSIINLCLKPISIILGLVYTPLLLGYLGDEKYGLWATILSIISWVNYCDIGIGQGLRNLLTKELTNKRLDSARKAIATGYITLTIISTILLTISILLICGLNWYEIFNTNINMNWTLIFSFVFICINFILALSNTILFALQLSEMVAIRNCIVQVMNIVGLLVINEYSQENIVLVSVLFGATTTIVYICNTIQLFKNHKELIPHLKDFEKNKIFEISDIGIKFFVIQIACIALYTVDNILISNMYGGEAVTPFSITYKVFNTCYAFLAALIIPYWSKTTEAVEQKDYLWLKKSIIRLNCIGLVFCSLYILGVVFFNHLIYLWLGKMIDIPENLVLVTCVYFCLFSIVSVNTQFINGTGLINFQLIVMILMGSLNIPLSVFFAKKFEMGVVGVRLATTVLMLFAMIVFPINLWLIMKRFKKMWGK